MTLKEIAKSIWKTDSSMATVKTLFFIGAVGASLILLTFNYFFEFSGFAVVISKTVLGFFLIWVFDRFAIGEVDTIAEMKNGNIAYAIFYLALSLIVAAAIAGS